MALDHYVSQVHLRNFYSPALGGRMMHAIRKSDLKRFSCRSEDVCRIEEGSTNVYFHDERIIEEFLKTVEPKYNASLSKIRNEQIDPEVVYTIAGFIAYVDTCSPTAMRLGSPPIKSVVETTSELMDKHGQFDPAPASLGGKSVSELITSGVVGITVDEKYPQALGISNVPGVTSALGNSAWEFLHNRESGSLFFTSDFPTAIERLDMNTPVDKIVPLAPDLAVRIHPRIPKEREEPDFSFPHFKYVQRHIRGDQVRAINRQIVRCAEEFVFYCDDLPWVERFVGRNRDFWVETQVEKIPTPSGIYHLSHIEVAQRPR